MTKAIRVHNTGGPEVMTLEDVEIGQPSAGEVRVSHTAIGLNFIDVYFRTGAYPVQTPFTPGFEAAGVVEAVGGGVNNLSVGDRIAYAAQPIGAYAEERLIAADRVVKLPDQIEDRVGAAIMLKGMTTEYLLRRTYAISAGDSYSLSCSCWRGWSDGLSVGKPSRRNGYRHGRIRRKSRACPGAWLSSHYYLYPGRFCRTSERNHEMVRG